jgi:hypothetical protein
MFILMEGEDLVITWALRIVHVSLVVGESP